MERVSSERFSIDKLLTGRYHDLVPGRGVVGPVSLDLVDRAEEKILVDHHVNGRMTLEVALMLDLPGSFCLEFLEQFRPRHFEIGLGGDIEHIEDLLLGEDLVLGLFLP